MEEKKYVFHWPAFIIAFGIGLLYVYMSAPPQKIVLKYPTPYNAGKVTYRDSADTCFQFVANKVKCPEDRSNVKSQPIVM